MKTTLSRRLLLGACLSAFMLPALSNTAIARLVNSQVFKVDVFTSSGTWTKQPWAKRIVISMRGAGAGGGSGRRGAAGAARSGGLGGWASGAFVSSDLLPSQLPNSVAITIGAKGTGGAAQTVDNTNGNDGTAGGDTTFGSLYVASGGLKGPGGTAAATAVRAANVFNKGTTPLATSVTVALDVNTAQAAGGSGGSLSSANAELLGSWGGTLPAGDPSGLTPAAAGQTSGAAGADGATLSDAFLSTILFNGAGTGLFAALGGGGGGGAPNATGAGGPGGKAGKYGAGGGGGGASVNGFNSGKGGDGEDGICIVVQYAF